MSRIKKKRKSVGKRILYTLFGIFAAFILLFTGLRIYYRGFYEKAQKICLLPALKEGFVPQGIDYCEDKDLFVISGYDVKKKETEICLMNRDGEYRMVQVLQTDGNPLLSHAGGISLYGDYVYLAGCDGNCYILASSDLFSTEKDYVLNVGSFDTETGADFCYVKDHELYIGEYYYAVKFRTEKGHHKETPCGDDNKALIEVYDITEGGNPILKQALSIRGRIQGMCMTEDNRIIFSASSIFQGSQLYYYDYAQIQQETADTITLEGVTVPLYYIDQDNLLGEVKILPKSEGIAIHNGYLYPLFESATNRFQYGKLLDAQYLYRISVLP